MVREHISCLEQSRDIVSNTQGNDGIVKSKFANAVPAAPGAAGVRVLADYVTGTGAHGRAIAAAGRSCRLRSLLHARGEPRVCTKVSSGDETSSTRNHERERGMHFRAGAGCAASRGQRLYNALRVRPPGTQGAALFQVREYDPEDTVRFYALRLREAGMIRSTPQKIIAQGTDWQFLNELKKELKITRRESLNATGAVLLGVRPSPVAAAIADRLIHKGLLVRITGKSRRFETKVDPPQAA
jgi:hypothetical protein